MKKAAMDGKDSMSQLKRLSQVKGNKGILFTHMGATPGCHCPMHTSLATLMGIKGVSSLVIGMPECCFYSRFVTTSGLHDSEDRHMTYILDNRDVVFGCSEGIKEALMHMDQIGVKVIVMIFTCMPSLIGEDPKGIIEEIQHRITAKVVSVEIPHYKTNGYRSGYSLSWEALAQLCPKRETKKTVNIIGAASNKELEILKEHVQCQRYDVKTFGPRLHLEQIESITEGRINIVVEEQYEELAKLIEEKWNISSISLWDAYAMETIHQRYEQIMDFLGISESTLLKEAYSHYKSCEEQSLPFMDNVNFVITSSDTHTLQLSAYLSKLGMKPLFLHVEEWRDTGEVSKEQILGFGNDPLIGYITNREELVLDEKATVSIGHYKPFGNRCLPEMTIRKIQRGIGFERTHTYLEHIKRMMKEE